MIKAEANKIKSRADKGETKQKKKEALVGVAYTTTDHVRRAEEVATNLVFPEQSPSTSPVISSKGFKMREVLYEHLSAFV
jgi:hypothetical protein